MFFEGRHLHTNVHVCVIGVDGEATASHSETVAEIYSDGYCPPSVTVESMASS